ncbi:MAG: MarR family winged helix-turn-helix transcriptional regulator [Bacillota bacterium]|nr:MarR family winged helix-turn-helix transcriptional regulator [Bacillota bacterium]
MIEQTLTAEIQSLLFEFMGSYHEKFLHPLRKHGDVHSMLKKNQRKSLGILYGCGSMTATELGKKLDMEKGSLTTLIGSLENMGLVSRHDDPHDRRRALVALTPEGKKEMERVTEALQAHIKHMLEDIDETEQLEFHNHLQQVVAFIKRL